MGVFLFLIRQLHLPLTAANGTSSMISIRFAALALLALPAPADAQRRTMGEKPPDWDAIEKETSTGPRFAKRDVERFSGTKVLLDKRKDLKLSDDQVAKLREFDKQCEDGTKGLYTTLDSLRMAVRVRKGVDADVERARTSLARQEALRVIAEIQAVYDSTLKSALPLLDSVQQQSGSALVKKERAEADQELRQKLGGRRGP